MSYRKACLVVLLISSTAALAQVSHSEQVQVSPPLMRAVDPPAADAVAPLLAASALAVAACTGMPARANPNNQIAIAATSTTAMLMPMSQRGFPAPVAP